MLTTLSIIAIWIVVSVAVVGVFGLGSAIGYRRGYQDGLDAARTGRPQRQPMPWRRSA